mmetsp:Transcript_6855/g.6005  ORF Transcript_6855/g.6005 Transcript_6855/m.6005 type:complete len:106 (-) Transcript_6855:232-549(-)
MSGNIILVSKEGEEHTVEREFENMCNLIKVTLEDNDDDTKIPLEIIPSKHLKWIIDFCRRHKFKEPEEIKAPVTSNKLEDLLTDPKDVEFLESLSLEEKVDFLNN